MKLTDAQWALIAEEFPVKKRTNRGGRPPADPREVLNGVLWVLSTGARWSDLPDRYPAYQTCHRKFQEWVEGGVFERVLTKLRQDLLERGGLELEEAYIDGTYVPAKKGGHVWANLVAAAPPRSWRSQTAMVFHSVWLLTQETDTTVLSPTQRSMLQSFLNPHPD